MAIPGRQRFIAVVGPTATGKTALGIEIAKALETEILSADSRIIYRELNIGTAKPTLEEMQGIPHHMLDRAAPTEAYSVSRYQEEARPLAEALHRAGKLPVVVGGTGFYLRALLQEEFVPPVPPDEAFRAEMQQLAARHGSPWLHARLAERDPQRAAALHPNDRFRIIRALEIIHQTGAEVPNQPKPLGYDVLWIGLTYADRDKLRARIDERIVAMMQAGWLEEVADLMRRYGPEAEALTKTHGYPELVGHLQGKLSLEEALESIRIQIHQYARRQMTWFRRNPEIYWLSVDELGMEGVMRQALGVVQDQEFGAG
jgi:tRNA dimethylallyltransferase